VPQAATAPQPNGAHPDAAPAAPITPQQAPVAAQPPAVRLPFVAKPPSQPDAQQWTKPGQSSQPFATAFEPAPLQPPPAPPRSAQPPAPGGVPPPQASLVAPTTAPGAPPVLPTAPTAAAAATGPRARKKPSVSAATSHACANCSLPLSAKAKFCRRCGSPQH
jgi:hypothetical protein